MTPFKQLSSLFAQLAGRRKDHLSTVAASVPQVRHTEFYGLLRAYYFSNDLYDALRDHLYVQATWTEATRALRNPTNRVVEFYASHLWPGANLDEALPIETENSKLLEPIQQIWTWSNWGAKKQLAARQFAMLGDLFIKVAQTEGRVYQQIIPPEAVTAFEADVRGFIVSIRIDTPVERTVAGKAILKTRTETWDKAANSFRVWEHVHGATAETSKLGDADLVASANISDFGLSFIPVVHAPFRDVGEDRGAAAITHAIDKVDEANRQATRLHQMLFRHNKPTWALQANGVTGDKRPLPAPRIGTSAGDPAATAGVVTLGDDPMLRLPGMATLQSLVPQIDYGAQIDALRGHMAELREDLPELGYYQLADAQELSGKAIRYMLGGAVARVLEARGNGEMAMIRAAQMGITIGQLAGVFDRGIGTYEQGALDFTFRTRPVIDDSPLERAEAEAAEVAAKAGKAAIGVPNDQLLRELDYPESEIRKFAAEREANAAAMGEAMLTAFDRGGPAAVDDDEDEDPTAKPPPFGKAKS